MRNGEKLQGWSMGYGKGWGSEKCCSGLDSEEPLSYICSYSILVLFKEEAINEENYKFFYGKHVYSSEAII